LAAHPALCPQDLFLPAACVPAARFPQKTPKYLILSLRAVPEPFLTCSSAHHQESLQKQLLFNQ
jgi:hypothetical protein